MGAYKPIPNPQERRAMSDIADRLSLMAGVFKGENGLRGLVDSQEFWDKQPYGTRLYYGDGGADYLHRDVLRAAVRCLEELTVPSFVCEECKKGGGDGCGHED